MTQKVEKEIPIIIHENQTTIDDFTPKCIASMSGGKDSVTQTDLLLKNGHPVDEIIFNDTLQELPQMYPYIEKLKEYFFKRYNMKITVLKPLTTFEEWCIWCDS